MQYISNLYRLSTTIGIINSQAYPLGIRKSWKGSRNYEWLTCYQRQEGSSGLLAQIVTVANPASSCTTYTNGYHTGNGRADIPGQMLWNPDPVLYTVSTIHAFSHISGKLRLHAQSP
ncbi:hypothetical protein NEUTE1DRAFT_114046 [Neurospora tetrasperma FGSC 2508]|uniref:Uncharacterized protein n=1 Tax=Neurospora tetrasperma (strain FGSC 2508 / ATCC MYA-4615 / P0657) TaxID=510951 RepID=F8MZE1_NEUT8|nr:uncharacterized protein NEUTE1DRAFT_114046 [Neurospora tetrasperma FGSC 2508]EGO52032.1 hypothetical protein NEUTE1DRAFT_114046 [Neurospora tetrasperma FGSC 2508]